MTTWVAVFTYDILNFWQHFFNLPILSDVVSCSAKIVKSFWEEKPNVLYTRCQWIYKHCKVAHCKLYITTNYQFAPTSWLNCVDDIHAQNSDAKIKEAQRGLKCKCTPHTSSALEKDSKFLLVTFYWHTAETLRT